MTVNGSVLQPGILPMGWRKGACSLLLGMYGVVSATELPEPKEGFLCCNLQVEDGWISDINQRTESSRMVPAGTPLKATGYGRYRVKLMVAGKPMELGNDYSRKVELRAFAQRYIVAQDPADQLATWAPEVREAVRSGQLLPGMTREQVLMAVGYPVADTTPDLDSPDWKFWATSELEYRVGFDAGGRVVTIEGDDKALAVVAPTLLSRDRLEATTAGERYCAVNVYRPERQPFGTGGRKALVYVDGEQRAPLSAGETMCLSLEPGAHRIGIGIQPGWLLPVVMKGEQTVDVAEGRPATFLRYSMVLARLSFVGVYATAIYRDEFDQASEGRWRNRD